MFKNKKIMVRCGKPKANKRAPMSSVQMMEWKWQPPADGIVVLGTGWVGMSGTVIPFIGGVYKGLAL
jgi:hypothetical protein